MSTKIATIIGARPQFIKASAIANVVDQMDGLEEIIIHTGQHYDDDMSQVFFEELNIRPPKYNLNIGGGPHGQMTGQQIIEIERVLLEAKPDLVLVYGDTNSTLAGAVAASKMHLPVAHVEAGLRSFNRRMPEEVNRIMTDHVSDWLFPPTKNAAEILIKEGLGDRKVKMVGDVMYDVARQFAANRESRITPREQLKLPDGSIVLATIHRQENTDDPERIREIFRAFVELARNRIVVLPLHPRLKALKSEVLNALPGIEKIYFSNPLPFGLMADLLAEADVVVTDSGGLQKEAYFNQTPCVTVREETEWTELVEAGWNLLPQEITSEAILAAVQVQLQAAPTSDVCYYGDGTAAKQIINFITQTL